MNKDILPRVKVFNSYDSDELEELINNFIDELDKKNMDIKDIEYSSVVIAADNNACRKTTDIYRYSALITYGLTEQEIKRRKHIEEMDKAANAYIEGLKKIEEYKNKNLEREI